MKLIIVFFISLVSIPAFSQKKEFGWLIGTWKIENKNTFETWALSPDAEALGGRSFRLKGTDTLITEEIKIIFKDDFFHYVPDVAGDQGPVFFKITKHTENSFTAENPEHDFPKIIHYKKIQNSTQVLLEATIEGNGKSISYHFEKLL